MAFTAARAVDGAQLAVGDRLFLYTSRGCFGNPGRDKGRVIGEAEVLSPLRRRPKPVTIAGRDFTHDCRIAVKSLAPYGTGVDLSALVPQLHAFPDPRSWSARMRRPLLQLPDEDAELIASLFAPVARRPADALSTYSHVLTSRR